MEPRFSTTWEREDYEREQRGEKPLGPDPWKPRETKWDWRSFLTADEAATIAPLEAEAAKLRARLSEIAAVRQPMQNRAIQRAKYAASGANPQPSR